MAEKVSLLNTLYYYWLFVFSFEINFSDVLSATAAEVDQHLALGIQLMGRGQLQDALSHFHSAVDGDPNNYLTYFRRATVYLALGKSKAAIPDLDRVIELKPDFTSARIQRGNVLLKQGRLDEAHIDLENVLRRDPHNPEVSHSYSVIEALKRDYDLAVDAVNEGDYMGALHVLDKIIELCPWDVHLRNLRANCFISIGEPMRAISDLRAATKMEADSTAGHFKLAELHYSMGEADDALSEVRECLKLDPEHSKCFPFYKKVKKFAKQINNMNDYHSEQQWEDCITAANKVLETEKQVENFHFLAYGKLCTCYRQADQVLESIKACGKALDITDEPRLYCERAEAYLLQEEYDNAIRDFRQALDIMQDIRCAREGLERAEKLKKQAGRRDYYKILGVKRSANKKEIIRAYRKLAQKWHPDNYSNEDEKKSAEKKFMDIAAAKEVLTDKEKRQKFDSGEDPLDPESQQGQGFNPFQHFHHRGGGGGPFQFRFHFE